MGALTAPLAEPLIQRALLEIVLVGIPAALLGCWIVLYGTSYSAESLAHSLFPGLVVAALIGLPLLLCGGVAILIAALAIAFAGQLDELEHDIAVGIVVTTLFGLGVLLALSPASP